MLERLLHQPLAVILGALLIGLGGISAFRAMPVDLFPGLDYPLINIITHYPAGTAEDMELLLSRPIENAMLGLNDLRRVRSISAPGFSQVTVEFRWGLSTAQARQLVYARLAQVQTDLPAGVRPRIENIGTSLAMLSTYAVQGGDPVRLRSWVRYQLAPRLSALPGVARINVMGGGKAAWRVDIDPLRLLQYGLSGEQIADAIRASNVLATGGYIESHGRDLLIRGEGRLLNIDALRAVVVRWADDGTPLRLGDVARVYAGTDPQRYVITADRLPAVVFIVQKQPRASTLDVSREVDDMLARISLPPESQLTKFYDQAEIIGLAYRNMRNNLLLGAALAVVAVILVLGRNRASLIIAISFPLTVVGAFLFMRQFGLGINLMTLGALTVAIGLIDDDAIVVLENIDRHKAMGKTPLRAALDGTREILAPDVAGTLTVLAAFVPLILVTGLAGRLFQPFGITFSLVLLLSLLFSLTLIPLAAAHWLPLAPARASSERAPIGARWIHWAGHWNEKLLGWMLRHRPLSLGGALALLLASISLLAFNPARMLPLLDEGSLLLGYQLAPGTSLDESNRVGDQLEKALLAMPEIKAVFRRTGSPGSSFYIERPDEGELVLRLDHRRATDTLSVKARVDRLIAAMPGVVGRVNDPTSEKIDESFSGLPALFGITLYGRDLKVLYQAAEQVEQLARKTPGLVNVVNNTKIPVDQLQVRIDRAACARLGVMPETVVRALHRAFQGEAVSQVVKAQQPINIFLRYSPAARRTVADLSAVLVPGSGGGTYRLGELAEIRQMAGYPSIEHQQGLRTLTLTAEIDGNPWSAIHYLDQGIAALHLPEQIEVGYTGEYQQLLQTGGQMLWVILGAAMLVYGIIAIQLGSLLDPLVVITKLPVDFMGAALALFLTHRHLDLTVLIGFVTLIGVATNNGIMLLTFTRDFRRQGLDAVAAVTAAVRRRTRPMLLTHLTTLLALVPAALGLGQGPQLLQPLAIMLFGGLTAGTLLTLNLLPVIYVATERWRKPCK